MKKPELNRTLEALLFVATTPVTLANLSSTTESAEEDVVAALDELKQQLQDRGLCLTETQGAYQLVTAPGMSAVIERFLGSQAKSELSRPALETLAIIVYRQPVTRLQIEEIRGIASDQTIRNLLLRELIVEAGVSKEPGKPVVYRPSHRLLHILGLSSFSELPSLDSLVRENDAD